MHGAAHRANVLRAYRELLALLRGLPGGRREAALAEARAGVRANAAETDAGKASDQLKHLCARISFLRTVRRARRCAVAAQGAWRRTRHANKSRVVCLRADAAAAAGRPRARQRHVRHARRRARGGRRRAPRAAAAQRWHWLPAALTRRSPCTRAGTSAGERVATGVLDMSEARSRHAALVKRQYYGRTPSRMEPF